jgi:hypothetical protein
MARPPDDGFTAHTLVCPPCQAHNAQSSDAVHGPKTASMTGEEKRKMASGPRRFEETHALRAA